VNGNRKAASHGNASGVGFVCLVCSYFSIMISCFTLHVTLIIRFLMALTFCVIANGPISLMRIIINALSAINL
jgi:hypothetical protein